MSGDRSIVWLLAHRLIANEVTLAGALDEALILLDDEVAATPDERALLDEIRFAAAELEEASGVSLRARIEGRVLERARVVAGA